ncbi:MAG: ABC transporter permease [Steroidobacteraceae bacterium]
MHAIRYAFELATGRLRKHPFLALTVSLTIGLGIGACMTTTCIVHVLTADPIPNKKHTLLETRLMLDGSNDEDTADSLTYRDANALLASLQPPAVGSISAQGIGDISIADSVDKKKSILIRLTDKNFFRVFDVPILVGQAWDEAVDQDGAHVAIIGEKLAQSLFGRETTVAGEEILIGDSQFRIVGVIGDWRPVPRYYDLSVGAYEPADEVYIPITSTRDLNDQISTSFRCADGSAMTIPKTSDLMTSGCYWISMWADIPLSWHSAYRTFVIDYVSTLHSQGLTAAEGKATLRTVTETLRKEKVVPNEVRVYAALGFCFMALCLLSVTSTLLPQYLRRSAESGLRRALGASQINILMESLAESLLLGIAGATIGLILTQLGLTLLHRIPVRFTEVSAMDKTMLCMLIGIAVTGSIATGAYPAWKMSRLAPRVQMQVL